VDLAALARMEVERWADNALDKDIDLGYDGPDGTVTVAGEAHLLRELLANLIDNAIRYNRRGGVVTLVLWTPVPPASGTPAVMLAVEDDGPGIPAAERSLVLERFYRGGSGAASEGNAGGCGLGLPIAHEIAVRHGATLRIEARTDGPGTRVLVVFPAEAG
ncbi:MAG: HAMP domain-containing sensor histidine kinase, partial [Duganella sp.]